MSELHDLIIIGGGPAGLTTGIYSSRSGLDVVLLEKQMPGGQISTSQRVENFPGYSEAITGMELTDKMQEQAKKFGTKIENFNDVTSLKKKDNVLTIKAGDKEFSSYA
ncbi:MAG: FAD-dependent oxidoreductase, partial [Actinomycetia bacterium]|nr:FAD-dependent oxidoreductase [Actinomycetes bacterium]